VVVTNFGSASISIISTETDEMVATVAVGRAPNDVAITADDTRAFVTNQAETTVSVIALPGRS
jgi:YVTN family beta-propeller protein